MVDVLEVGVVDGEFGVDAVNVEADMTAEVSNALVDALAAASSNRQRPQCRGDGQRRACPFGGSGCHGQSGRIRHIGQNR